VTPALRLREVSKRFGNVWAVRNVNLEIPYGSICAYLGPNGAGKTTTLRLIAGLLFPDAGSIEIGGRDPITDWLEVKRELSYVPDVPFLYDKLTGEEFLRFVGGLHGMDDHVMRQKVEYFVHLFGLGAFHRQRVESYSHGTRQKYVVSAALLSAPRVLLVDEPMVGLDPASGKILKSLFRSEADNGMAILLSTHTLSVAQELADTITVLNEGTVVLSGKAETILGEANGRSLEDLFLEITSKRP
jgi:ABC-2 type transport system ATP-binding protein